MNPSLSQATPWTPRTTIDPIRSANIPSSNSISPLYTGRSGIVPSSVLRPPVPVSPVSPGNPPITEPPFISSDPGASPGGL